MLTRGPSPTFWKAMLLTVVATLALIIVLVIWHESYSSTDLLPPTPHTCITPTPDPLYGGFRSPYPSAPFCTGR